MIYVGKNKLVQLVTQAGYSIDSRMLDYFIERNKIKLRPVEHVDSIVESDILVLLLDIVPPIKAYEILVKIINHSDDKVTALQEKIAWYEKAFANAVTALDMAKESLTKAMPKENIVLRNAMPVTTIPAPAPKKEKKAEEKPVVKLNKSGTMVGMKPVLLKLEDLTKEQQERYQALMKNTQRLFNIKGIDTGITIYNLLGTEFVRQMAASYEKEHKKEGCRITQICAPMLASIYYKNDYVRNTLRDIMPID